MDNGADSTDDEKPSILGDIKHTILGQMKCQFNSSSSLGGTSSTSSDGGSDEKEEQQQQQQQLVLNGGDEPKPLESDKSTTSLSSTTSNSTSTSSSSGATSASSRNAESSNESAMEEGSKPPPIIVSIRKAGNNKMTTRSGGGGAVGVVDMPKRSTRRRSKDCTESVLASAIARKEKSYNETVKPQRLTRRELKPTPKILENIANAAAQKEMKMSPPKREGKKAKKVKGERKRRGGGGVGSSGGGGESSGGGSSGECRRSGRLTSLQQGDVSTQSESDDRDVVKTEVFEDENGFVDGEQSEEGGSYSSHFAADSATAQLIASRLCVCTSPTKYTPLSESSICCNALDSINDRLIGCNNNVSRDSAWMLRPSTRVPYMVLCRPHRQRLRDHHCCAMCGIFCTQGEFLQCAKKHLYHEHCKLSIGDLECCPHCGATDTHCRVRVMMKCAASPVYTPTQCVQLPLEAAASFTASTDATTDDDDRQRKASSQPSTAKRTSEAVLKKIGVRKAPEKRRRVENQMVTVTVIKKRRKVPRLPPPPPPAPKEEPLPTIKTEPELYDEDLDEIDVDGHDASFKPFAVKAEKVDAKDDDEDVVLIVCAADELEKLAATRKQVGDEEKAVPPKRTIQQLFTAIKGEMYGEVASLLGDNHINLAHEIDYYMDDPKCEEHARGTVLHYAAMKGLVPIMHMLKIADIDLDVADSENNTPLMVAVATRQLDAVKYLADAGASITKKGTDGMTALHLACKCGYLQVAKELLLAAVQIDGYIDCPDDGGWTPLVWACEHNHVAVVRLLLAEGADPQLRDVEGNVALHWAAFGGSIAIVELILSFGGKLDSTNEQGDTPLHIAARHNNYNCVMLFLTRGANIHAKNDLGETPIDCAPERSKTRQQLLVNEEVSVMIKKKTSA